MIWLLGLTGLVWGSSSKLDPCWFAGWRFARTESRCESLICQGLARMVADGAIRPTAAARKEQHRDLTCEEAAQISEDFIGRFPEHDTMSSSDRDQMINDILRVLETTVVTDGRRMLFGAPAALMPETIEVMSWIDFHLMRVLREVTDDDWQGITNRLRSSKEYDNLRILALQINDWSSNAPFSLDIIPGNFGSFSNFLFDLVSLIENPQTWVSRMGSINILAEYGLIEHRSPHWTEYRRRLVLFHEQSTDLQIKFAEMLDNFDYLDSPSIAWVVQVIATIDNRPSHKLSAAEAVIRRQLGTRVCGKLVKMMPQLMSIWKGFKKLVTLLDVCRRSVSERDIVTANRELMRLSDARVAELVSEALPGFESEPLSNIQGLEDSERQRLMVNAIEHCLRIQDPLENGLFKQREKFESTCKFEKSMRMFGRCIGFSVLYAGKVNKVLRMRRSLAMTLYKKLEEEDLLAELGLVHKYQLTSVVYEPVHFIRIGIQDIVGPLGVQAFSEFRWTLAIVDTSNGEMKP